MSDLRKRVDSNKTKYINDELYIQCKDCEEFKKANTDNFLQRKETTFGFRSTCKPCFRLRRNIQRNTPEAKRSTKNTRLKCTFGITLEEFDKMRKEQNYRCLICKKHEDEFFSKTASGKVKGFVVDHNHDTGDVRGLLCSECNVGVGFLQDSIGILKAAIKYLEGRGSYGK